MGLCGSPMAFCLGSARPRHDRRGRGFDASFRHCDLISKRIPQKQPMRFIQTLPVLLSLTLMNSSCGGVDSGPDGGADGGVDSRADGRDSSAVDSGVANSVDVGVGGRDGAIGGRDGGVSGDSGSSLDAAISSDAAVPLSTEATTWLSEHNSRRQRYHTMYGSSYVPLRWSASLAASATRYAEEMARTGAWRHSDSPYGENLAWNGGIQSRAISDILTRWVENEEASWGGHFTQVLWRGTRYVGCGRASSPQHGSFQACQYAAPGNCGNRRRETMLADRTGCLPECPPEGCF